jgi:hypothetical protein
MNEEYIKYLFKILPFDYVVDYAFMCIKLKLQNEINKIVNEKLPKM